MKKRKRQARQVQGEGAPKMESVPEDVRKRQNRQKKIADSGFFTSTATDTTGAGIAFCSCGWQEKTKSIRSARGAARRHFSVHLPSMCD